MSSTQQDKTDLHEVAPRQERALLVGFYKNGEETRESCEAHLDELERLSDTCGYETVGKEVACLRKMDVRTVLTSGKLQEMQEKSVELKADVVVFDGEISPSQQRNIEEVFGIPIMDRTEVILDVFAQRAQTKEARLQVELAQIKYEAPRLKRLWTHLHRQRASGGAFVKGEGEKQIEIDRRLLQKRVLRLQDSLKEVEHTRQVQRKARERSSLPTFALIGYTNAGKSTLMNALTDAGVFVEDKLFATLDTTTRKFSLPNKQDILVIDTVGFIRKLPHTLVAAFRSTLEEALYADILLHLVDVSDPQAFEHAQATYEVLKELNSKDKPILTVLNKVDANEDPSIITRLRLTYPRTVQIAAKTKEGFEGLMELMMDELSRHRRSIHLRVPQSEYGLVSELKRVGHVIEEDYEGNDILLHVELPGDYAGRLEKYLEES